MAAQLAASQEGLSSVSKYYIYKSPNFFIYICYHLSLQYPNVIALLCRSNFTVCLPAMLPLPIEEIKTDEALVVSKGV
jgi:hypothetical protein